MGNFEEPGFGSSFHMPVIFQLFLVVIVGIILFAIISGLTTWTKNNNSPILTRICRVVSKRTRVSGGSGDSSAHTDYYLTFELDDGVRLELQVRDAQYGLTVEGDYGELTYQGTRFKSFTRLADPNSERF
ncbi:DUF2500 domain-containing protein [Gorillibacterium massiliense]|uniref:DUF2500 domain-containing protein n=1 Tax=Gorillibacterium massiliense TaxID=1280390 RepID=UPI0004B91786|nr:DUF2500 domain-containing protein [Gorillibacterium massiliense]